jgi:hypothetical protein
MSSEEAMRNDRWGSTAVLGIENLSQLTVLRGLQRITVSIVLLLDTEPDETFSSRLEPP